MNQNELYHYGVLGMKWGHRRARKMVERAKRLDQKGRNRGNDVYKAKANVLRAKANLINKRNVRLLGGGSRGEKAYDRIGKTGLAKAVAQTGLMGSYGALSYQEARAKGNKRGRAFAKAMAIGTLNNMAYGVPGRFNLVDRSNARDRERQIRKENIAKNKHKVDAAKSSLKKAKATMKADSKQLDKDWNKALGAPGLTKKQRARREELWDKTEVSGNKYERSRNEYKKLKKRYKQTKRNVYA